MGQSGIFAHPLLLMHHCWQAQAHSCYKVERVLRFCQESSYIVFRHSALRNNTKGRGCYPARLTHWFSKAQELAERPPSHGRKLAVTAMRHTSSSVLLVGSLIRCC